MEVDMRLGQACLVSTRRLDFGRLILTQLRGRIISQTGPILTGAQDLPPLCGRLVGQLPDVLRLEISVASVLCGPLTSP